MRLGLEGDVRAHFVYHDGSTLCDRSAADLQIIVRRDVQEPSQQVLVVCGECLRALADFAREASAPPAGQP
jgi:hypothetical protein